MHMRDRYTEVMRGGTAPIDTSTHQHRARPRQKSALKSLLPGRVAAVCTIQGARSPGGLLACTHIFTVPVGTHTQRPRALQVHVVAHISIRLMYSALLPPPHTAWSKTKCLCSRQAQTARQQTQQASTQHQARTRRGPSATLRSFSVRDGGLHRHR